MQNIKPSDMTELEEFGVWLAAIGEQDTNSSPVEAGNPPPTVPPSEAENGTENPMAKCCRTG
jgi:hypothetical protein